MSRPWTIYDDDKRDYEYERLDTDHMGEDLYRSMIDRFVRGVRDKSKKKDAKKVRADHFVDESDLFEV